MRRSTTDDLDWLTPALRAWVHEHRDALDQIVSAFERSGAWPDPVVLEREARARGGRGGVLVAVASMPRALGWRDHHPSQVTLTIFGLGSVSRARPLLEALIVTKEFALQRFDDPGASATLSRKEVQEALEFDDNTMDQLSRLILGTGNFFLSGGNATFESWELGIDERIVGYQDDKTVEDVLQHLANERLANPPVALEPVAEPTTSVGRGTSQSVLLVASVVLGLCADVAAFALAPLWLAVGLTATVLCAIALHRAFTTTPPRPWAFVVVALVGIAAACVSAVLTEPNGPPPMREQLAAIQRDAQRDHRRVVFSAAADLRGVGHGPSQVMVLRDDRIPDPPQGEAPTDERGRFIVPRSDELRIYNSIDGRLREAFRFLSQGAGQIRQRPEGDTPQFHFAAQIPADIDGDGRPELFGAFTRVTLATAPLPAPVVVLWDDASQQFRLSPIAGRASGLRAKTEADRHQREAYTNPTPIVDRYTGRRFSPYATDTYAIVSSRPYAILVAGYVSVDMNAKSPERWALQAWTLDLEGGTAELSQCFEKPTVLIGAQTDPANALTRWFVEHPPPACEP